MSLAIYKPGQGYWTRLMSAIGAGMLVVSGVAWAWTELQAVPKYTLYLQSGMAVAVILGFGALLFWLLNKPNIVEFMIATESEMNKVAWPSKRELMLLTWVVVVGTFMMAILLFSVDLLFGWLFQQIGILLPSLSS